MAFCLCCSIPSMGSADTYRTSASISGTINKPTCKFNFSGSKDIKFEEVDIKKISTEQYRIPIELKVSCGLQPASVLLKLTGVAGFRSDLIKTNIEGLGIKLTSQRLGTTWQPNTSIRTTTQNNNSIYATLVSNPDTQFKSSEFSSTVSISADYD